MTNWLSVKVFSERTGLSVAWVHVLINDKAEGLKFQRPGHEYLISEACVERFAKNGTQAAIRQKAAKTLAKKNGRVKLQSRTNRVERASR